MTDERRAYRQHLIATASADELRGEVRMLDSRLAELQTALGAVTADLRCLPSENARMRNELIARLSALSGSDSEGPG